MEWQKNRKGYGEAEKQKVMEWQKNRKGYREAERQRRTWSGRKTEKDIKRQKNREVDGQAERH